MSWVHTSQLSHVVPYSTAQASSIFSYSLLLPLRATAHMCLSYSPKLARSVFSYLLPFVTTRRADTLSRYLRSTLNIFQKKNNEHTDAVALIDNCNCINKQVA